MAERLVRVEVDDAVREREIAEDTGTGTARSHRRLAERLIRGCVRHKVIVRRL